MASSLLLKFLADEFGGEMVHEIWSCWSILLGLEHFPTDDGDAEGDETENFDPALWWPDVEGDFAPWIEVSSWIGVNGLGDLGADEEGGLGGNLEPR